MGSAQARDLAIATARTDPQRSAEQALRIADPWMRCQALAWVAWLTPDHRKLVSLIRSAEKSAQESDDAYVRAAALAWPIRALAERGLIKEASAMAAKALAASSAIANPVTHADATFLLWQAAFPMGGSTRSKLLGSLIAACTEADSWKTQQILRDAAEIVATVDVEISRQVIEAIKPGPARRQAERSAAEGRRRAPRDFFW